MPRKVKTVITETHTDEGEHTLESWLIDLGRRSEIVTVRLFKRDGDDWRALPRASDILPPFGDIDPQYVFSRWGDGTYKFVSVRHDEKFSGSRVESVRGLSSRRDAARRTIVAGCRGSLFSIVA